MQTTSPTMMPSFVPGAQRAFSLVEMMVVLLILGVVMAIVVPALSAARNTARKAATSALMSGLGNAASQFQMDERRLPGYFTQRDIGAAENGDGTRGFSTMNNLMADLCGGVVESNTTATTIQVGPRAGATQIYIDTALIGSSRQIKGVTNKAYFQPDPKFFGITAGKDGGPAHMALPDLFDSWGTPIMAWQQDEVPSTSQEFAEMDSGSPALFYWVQNAAFLKSTGLGKFTINQAMDSVIGLGAGSDAVDSLEGVLGTPAFADPTDPTMPAAARAPIIFHSAGYNSIFCGKRERGGRLAAGNPIDPGEIAYTSPRDAMDAFDDILAKVSN